MATKERLAAMAASLCAVCSGAMVVKLVEVDPSNSALELRTYVCAGCGHSQTYGVDAGDGLTGDIARPPTSRWRELGALAALEK